MGEPFEACDFASMQCACCDVYASGLAMRGEWSGETYTVPPDGWIVTWEIDGQARNVCRACRVLDLSELRSAVKGKANDR